MSYCDHDFTVACETTTTTTEDAAAATPKQYNNKY